MKASAKFIVQALGLIFCSFGTAGAQESCEDWAQFMMKMQGVGEVAGQKMRLFAPSLTSEMERFLGTELQAIEKKYDEIIKTRNELADANADAAGSSDRKVIRRVKDLEAISLDRIEEYRSALLASGARKGCMSSYESALIRKGAKKQEQEQEAILQKNQKETVQLRAQLQELRDSLDSCLEKSKNPAVSGDANKKLDGLSGVAPSRVAPSQGRSGATRAR
ncbi:MAG: hypothetical protein RJB38_827 [Pseudomonadota bacterium]|jgi:hypothetical protein